jgi:outer membrane protein TolC
MANRPSSATTGRPISSTARAPGQHHHLGQQRRLGFSYALDLWGRESNATERAVDMAHMSVAEARQAQLELQNNVVRAYIELSLHYAQRDIVAATLKQQQQILDLAQKRLNGGIGTHFEVSQAETPLPETHRQIDALDEEIALSRNQLAALAGKGPARRAVAATDAVPGRALKLPSALPAAVARPAPGRGRQPLAGGGAGARHRCCPCRFLSQRRSGRQPRLHGHRRRRAGV